MMRSVTVVVLLVMEVANPLVGAQVSMDSFVDKFVNMVGDKLFNRALNASSLHHGDLDNVTLGKPAHLSIPSSSSSFASSAFLNPTFPSSYFPRAFPQRVQFRRIPNVVAHGISELSKPKSKPKKAPRIPQSDPSVILPQKRPAGFQELGIASVLWGQLSKQFGITKPTGIQVATAPEILRKSWNPKGLPVHDILIEDKTGGGKTLAYVLPILTNLDNYLPKLQAIICAPTRELVVQIYKTVQGLSEGGKKDRKLNPIKVMAMEGMGFDDVSSKERDAFDSDTPHVLIATPPMVEFVLADKSETQLEDLKAVVLDEVDQLLSMPNNREGAMYLLPQAREHDAQIIFVSATITADAVKISKKYMNNPKRVIVPPTSVHEKQSSMPARLRHWVSVIYDRRPEYKMLKLAQLHNVLKHRRLQESPPKMGRPGGSIGPKRTNVLPSDRTSFLVFINDPTQIRETVEGLRENFGFRVRGLGARSTREHYSRILRELADGELDMLVATDVLARGMDMYGVTDVVNYDIPRSTNMYLHRAGRAGRMKGKFSQQSTVISFVDPQDQNVIEEDVSELGAKVKRCWINQRKIVVRPFSETRPPEGWSDTSNADQKKIRSSERYD